MVLVLTAVVVAAASAVFAAPQMDHEKHMAQIRAEKGMGFGQARATHHFRLSAKGGVIEVHVRQADDRETRDKIAAHLEMIAGQFAKGDFATAFAVHGEDPAGVPALKRLGAGISYTFVRDPAGGQVVISSESPEAVTAIHDFLRYQIREHKTGDPLQVPGR